MGLLTLAEDNGWEAQWKDVVDMLRNHLEGTNAQKKTFRRQSSALSSGQPRRGIRKDRPTYGPPVVPVPLAHGPMNELGVMFLFGMMAAQLGFVVTRIQAEFPDCEVMREVAPGMWQREKVEVEYESRNFVKHMHDPKGCDAIVCWIDNWPECPLEVIELSKEIAGILPQQAKPGLAGDPGIAAGSPSSRGIGKAENLTTDEERNIE